MCGTTSLEDASAALYYGVDAIGFIFVEKSPRYIRPEAAREIIKMLPPFFFKVGVVVNMQAIEIAEIIHFLGLNGIQLHGDEKPEECRKLAALAPTCSIIKAFRVGEESQPAQFLPYEKVVSGYLLDTYVKGLAGGTGKTFAWSLVDRLQLKRPVILAGGLNSGNVSQALRAVRPFAVDVNSGVEVSPGKKDHNLLKQFVSNVQALDRDTFSG